MQFYVYQELVLFGKMASVTLSCLYLVFHRKHGEIKRRLIVYSY